MSSPGLLLTNDDGIESPGLQTLARRLAPNFDVIVAAPAHDVSGSGTGIGRFDPEKGVELRRVDFDGAEVYSIDGPPGLAVMAAALGAFGDPPDLVVSGINAGINTGHSVIHSGTVGGALTARTFGARGMAVSLAQSDPWHWETAAEVAEAAVEWILGRPSPQVLNINVPALPAGEVKGAHWADLDEVGYFRVANAEMESMKLQLQVGPTIDSSDAGSDTYLCSEGYVAVTPLSTVEPAPFPDVSADAIWAPRAVEAEGSNPAV
jgi:5'-nucleotidase